MTKTSGNFTDFVSFSRASKGTALRRIAYGSELVTNGTFDTDSGWTKGTGWTISGGKGVATSVGSTLGISQSDVFPRSGVYQVKYDVLDYSAGAVSVWTQTYAKDNQRNADGTYTENIYALAGESLEFKARGTTTLAIDNISVKEVLFDDPSGDLVLFNHPDDIPRVEYDASGNVKGLLIEEQRTNLLTYSEDFTHAAWQAISTQLSSIAVDATIAPDGTTTAEKIILANRAGRHVRAQNVNFVNSNVFSCYIKSSGDGKFIGLKAGDAYAKFNPVDGSNTDTGGTHLISTLSNSVGNGWYRVGIILDTAGVAQTQCRIEVSSFSTGIYVSETGDGSSGAYIWGAQLEAGSFPTSYIPTSGATATRSADICSIDVDQFGYNQKAGSVVVDVDSFGDNTYQYAVALTPTSATGAFEIALRKSVSNWNYAVTNNSVAQANITEAFVSQAKLAGAYKANSFNASINGSTETEDTSGTVPSGLVDLRIGRQTAFYLNGHIKSIKYYPRRLSNAQLQELTS